VRVARHTEEATASGIYGVIVSAAVMAAAHQETVAAVEVAVLVTLVIYWAAERYSRVVAERIHQGHRPNWQQVRGQLTTGWEIVSASVLPLAVLAAAGLLGAEVFAAVLWALTCSTVLLCVAGWEMGRNGQLTTRERLASAATAGMFGVVLIGLKAILH
jgi:positive regulator of sigma E activity